jgi:pyruvate/2-oxoglutarate/acetoin dehydrogenase E1 component
VAPWNLYRHVSRFDFQDEPKMRYADELTRSMDYLAQDARTLFIGQAVAVKGTALTATFKNVPREKLLEFPVAEELQMGHSIGLALSGFTPVSVFPRFNFLMCAMNQLVNHLDKLPEMSGGGYQPKVIIRTCIGSVRPLDPGPQHKGDLTEAFRLLCPNLNVVRLDEAVEIFPEYQKALEIPQSTLLIEQGDFYNEK